MNPHRSSGAVEKAKTPAEAGDDVVPMTGQTDREAHERPPVLLVPGAVGQDLLYWNVMAKRLERDRFAPWTVTFPRFTMIDLRVSAEHLARRVEELCAETGRESVPLVCHSMGGLIARWYVKRLEGADRVSRLVFLSTPHRGTLTSLTGIPFRGARQVLPGSPFLNELNADRVVEVDATNVWSVTDMIVVPQLSAYLDADNVDNKQCTLAGHWGMLLSREVYGHLHEGVRAAYG